MQNPQTNKNHNMPLLVEMRQNQQMISATKANNSNAIFVPSGSNSSGTRNRMQNVNPDELSQNTNKMNGKQQVIFKNHYNNYEELQEEDPNLQLEENDENMDTPDQNMLEQHFTIEQH